MKREQWKKGLPARQKVADMKKTEFGNTASGKKAVLYTLENENGMRISVTDLGAALVNVIVKDKNGEEKDVVLGYDDAQGYEAGTSFLGAIVGRNANRIADAAFELNGKRYELAENENGNNLHSGPDFYNKRLWEVKKENSHSVTFALFSPDKDQGFPGDLRMEVTYTLTEDNEVKISYRGVTSEDTIINMTNHSYFNLNGEGMEDVTNHEVWIDADFVTKISASLIPTGKKISVDGTPMDFREKKAIGCGIDEQDEQLSFGGGYDHNWCLNNRGKYKKVAEATSPVTGITMEVFTDLPGMQMYTSNALEESCGKGKKPYGKHAAVCFETQYYPDAIHHENFEAPICKTGEVYETTTSYRFTSER